MLLGMAAPAAFPPRLVLEKRALWKQSPLPSLSLLLTVGVGVGALPYCPANHLRHVWFYMYSLIPPQCKTKIAVVIELKKNVLFIEELCDLILCVSL